MPKAIGLCAHGNGCLREHGDKGHVNEILQLPRVAQKGGHDKRLCLIKDIGIDADLDAVIAAELFCFFNESRRHRQWAVSLRLQAAWGQGALPSCRTGARSTNSMPHRRGLLVHAPNCFTRSRNFCSSAVLLNSTSTPGLFLEHICMHYFICFAQMVCIDKSDHIGRCFLPGSPRDEIKCLPYPSENKKYGHRSFSADREA